MDDEVAPVGAVAEEEEEEIFLTTNLTWSRSSPHACQSLRILDELESGLSTPRHCSTRTRWLEVDLACRSRSEVDLDLAEELLERWALTRETRTSPQVVCLVIPDTHLGRSWNQKGISFMLMPCSPCRCPHWSGSVKDQKKVN